MTSAILREWRRNDPAGMAAARQANKRQARINAAIRRLQPFADRIEGHYRAELSDAMRCGDNYRRLAAEREIDALHAELNDIVQALAKDLT